MKFPVDSKGAAIDKVIEALCVGVINANVLSLREQLDIDRELKAHAKQAILALLAQEVNKARIDELESVLLDGKRFGHRNGDAEITVKERLIELERLG